MPCTSDLVFLRSAAVSNHWVHAGKGVAAEVQLLDSSPQAHRLAAAFQSSAAALGEAGGQAGAKPARALQAVLGNAAMMADAGVDMPSVAQQHLEDLEVSPCSVLQSVLAPGTAGKSALGCSGVSQGRHLLVVLTQADGLRSALRLRLDAMADGCGAGSDACSAACRGTGTHV